MAAPADLGRAAARLLAGIGEPGVHYVEGPERYTPDDVARAFAQALGRDVRVAVTPRAVWGDAYRSLGFSPAAAASYARMTELTLAGPALPAAPERGETTLTDYIGELVRQRRESSTSPVRRSASSRSPS
jgi:uncharacterized protein YbjT (DUF2867 family)